MSGPEPYDWEGGAKARQEADAVIGCAGCLVITLLAALVVAIVTVTVLLVT